jgi:acyl-CoA synthetase (AMP-forming)/AMP-acid ligase II
VIVKPGGLAFIALSSGTTGRIKGVVHTHEEAIEGRHLGQYKLRIKNSGTYLIQATPLFIGWAMLLFLVLNTAAKAVFMEQWDPEKVFQITERRRHGFCS